MGSGRGGSCYIPCQKQGLGYSDRPHLIWGLWDLFLGVLVAGYVDLGLQMSGWSVLTSKVREGLLQLLGRISSCSSCSVESQVSILTVELDWEGVLWGFLECPVLGAGELCRRCLPYVTLEPQKTWHFSSFEHWPSEKWTYKLCVTWVIKSEYILRIIIP